MPKAYRLERSWSNSTSACSGSANLNNRHLGCQRHLMRSLASTSHRRLYPQNFTTMRNDSNFTFTELYDSADALLLAVENIEKIALTNRSDETPLHVRLLTPFGDTGQDFTITPIESFRGDEAYLAVSYAWAHEHSTESLDLPDYRIWDFCPSGIRSRSPRCPPIIFHRAVRYAQAKGYSDIWIDQECVHQDDDTDREQHLQLMHRIYRASSVTIAMLSTYIPTLEVFEEFVVWALENDNAVKQESRALPQGMLADWLMTMTRDRWFTRTWT
jgi:hypothetical protein